MNEKLSVLKLIGLGIHQTLVSEEVSCDDVDTIINGLPKPGEKIELSAEDITTILTIVLDTFKTCENVGGKTCFTQLRDF